MNLNQLLVLTHNQIIGNSAAFQNAASGFKLISGRVDNVMRIMRRAADVGGPSYPILPHGRPYYRTKNWKCYGRPYHERSHQELDC